MAIHKLSIEDFEDTNFELVAIHTSLEDYRLAFFINKVLNINLFKSKKDIQIKLKTEDIKFPYYEFEDHNNEIIWNLIQNVNETNTDSEETEIDLFTKISNNFSTKAYLLPEFKKVDYFLKIENTNSFFEINNIISLLNKIDKVNTVYQIKTDDIKSKNNLIF
jgi:hypothetical protein